jgi:IS30 family transposase
VAALVDRKSGCTVIVKIRSNHAGHVHQKTKARVKELHEKCGRLMILDNGTEFARCRRQERQLGKEPYFAESGCSHHHTNG